MSEQSILLKDYTKQSDPELTTDRIKQTRRRLSIGIAIGFLLILVSASILSVYHEELQHFEEEDIPATGYNGAVSTENPLCSDIGVDIMKQGGNAVDAAIASTICIGTINSFSSGIGGGGFMVIRLPSGESTTIDFRETAPALANETMYSKNYTASEVGGLSVGIPGEIRGLEMAHKKYGKMSWSSLFEPSIKIAKEGFKASVLLNKRLTEDAKFIVSSEAFSEIYAPNGKIVKVGELVKRQKFGDTLQKIATFGSDAFYSGAVAQSMVDLIGSTGGIITLKDLEMYKPKEKKPLIGWYHGKKIITTALPTSGAVLIAILNVLEDYDYGRTLNHPLEVHRLVEAMKYGFALRTEMGDDDYLPAEFQQRFREIVSKELASQIRANITDDITHPVEYYNPHYEPVENPGTTHISTLDNRDGMAVSITSTINLSFGSKLMCRETGIILNNEMNDFSIPGKTNAFGLRPSKNNFIRAGKRPLSSTVPTIIEDNGKIMLAAGASGGSLIITSTLQTILNVLHYNMNVQQAISAPRVHHQLVPNQVAVEYLFGKNQWSDNGKLSNIREYLQYKNHTLKLLDSNKFLADVQCLQRFPDGRLEAGSDKRKGGKASAF